MIIPIFLAITYLGQQSIYYLHLITLKQNFDLLPLLLAAWLAQNGGVTFVQGQLLSYTTWGVTMTLTGLITSMAVNGLVTGLIVFRILKVFLVKANSIERNLGSTGGGISLQVRNIVFVIIESGMALFAIQLVRVLFYILPSVQQHTIAGDLITGINEMFNVIIISTSFVFTDLLITFTWLLGHRTNNDFNNFGAGLNEILR